NPQRRAVGAGLSYLLAIVACISWEIWFAPSVVLNPDNFLFLLALNAPCFALAARAVLLLLGHVSNLNDAWWFRTLILILVILFMFTLTPLLFASLAWPFTKAPPSGFVVQMFLFGLSVGIPVSVACVLHVQARGKLILPGDFGDDEGHVLGYFLAVL